MKWLLDTYPQAFIAISVIVPFLFWTYYGFVGRFKPWRDNIYVIREKPCYIVTSRGLRAITSAWEWEREREDWLRVGVAATGLVIVIFIIYVLS